MKEYKKGLIVVLSLLFLFVFLKPIVCAEENKTIVSKSPLTEIHKHIQNNKTEPPYLPRLNASTTSGWINKGYVPVDLNGHTLSNVGDKIYLIGGCYYDVYDTYYNTDMYEYSPANNTWSILNNYGKKPYPISNHGSAVIDNDDGSKSLYIFGGQRFTYDLMFYSTLSRFDSVNNYWTTIPYDTYTPFSRSGHGMTALNKSLYVFGGGFDDVYHYILNDFAKYDTYNNRWTSIDPPGLKPSYREGCTLVTLDNKLYLFGGSGVNGDYGDLWVFSPGIASWKEISPNGSSPGARSYHTACAVNGKLYIIGGYHETEDDWVILNDTWRYDPVRNKWDQMNNCLKATSEDAAAPYQGTILLVGGGTGAISDSLMQYTPPPYNDSEAVEADYNLLQIGFAPGDCETSITKDLNLPSLGTNGSTIVWKSNNTNLIDINGKVNRLADINAVVTLTADISKGTAKATKTFSVILSELTNDEEAVGKDKEALTIGFASGDSSSLVSHNLTLPTVGEYGSTITWTSNNENLVTNTGQVFPSRRTVQVTLTARLTKGNATASKVFNIGVRRPPEGCFIATAAFGSYLNPHVWVLRNFRDQVLLHSSAGKWFVREYYKYSPPIAKVISQHYILRLGVRLILTPLIFGVMYPWAAEGVLIAIVALIAIRFVVKRRYHVEAE